MMDKTQGEAGIESRESGRTLLGGAHDNRKMWETATATYTRLLRGRWGKEAQIDC